MQNKCCKLQKQGTAQTTQTESFTVNVSTSTPLCSAFQPRLQRASQMLYFYSSVSQNRPQSAVASHYTRLSGLAPASFSRHLPFALRTSRGTPLTIYPVNTQPLAFRLFAQGKPLQVSHYARHQTSRTSPFTGNISAAVFSSK